MRALLLVIVVAGCGSKTDGPSCGAVSKHVATMLGADDPDYARDVEGVFLARCTEDKWSAAARSCITSTTSAESPKNCKQQLTAAQVSALDAAIAAADVRLANRTIPQACFDYEVQLAAAKSCAAVPADVHAQLAASLAENKREWAKKVDAKELEVMCTGAIAALKQLTSACAPPKPAP